MLHAALLHLHAPSAEAWRCDLYSGSILDMAVRLARLSQVSLLVMLNQKSVCMSFLRSEQANPKERDRRYLAFLEQPAKFGTESPQLVFP